MLAGTHLDCSLKHSASMLVGVTYLPVSSDKNLFIFDIYPIGFASKVRLLSPNFCRSLFQKLNNLRRVVFNSG